MVAGCMALAPPAENVLFEYTQTFCELQGEIVGASVWELDRGLRAEDTEGRRGGEEPGPSTALAGYVIDRFAGANERRSIIYRHSMM